VAEITADRRLTGRSHARTDARHVANIIACIGISSVRFVKKHWGGESPTGERVETPQALTCNTNTGVRIDPPRSSNRRRLAGSKIIGRVEPPRQIGPWLSAYSCAMQLNDASVQQFDRGLFAEGRGLWRGLMCRTRSVLFQLWFFSFYFYCS